MSPLVYTYAVSITVDNVAVGDGIITSTLNAVMLLKILLILLLLLRVLLLLLILLKMLLLLLMLLNAATLANVTENATHVSL